MANEKTFTYETRLLLDEQQGSILQECASLLSATLRSLYAEVARGKNSASCKNTFLKEYEITARQFNACRISLEGKISAYQATQEIRCASLKQQIDTLDKKIKLLEKKPSKRSVVHHKKRRKNILAARLSSIEEDQKQKRTRVCFGGKKLFSAQYHLEKNGFASHAEWKKAWEEKRNNEFFVLGSKDEASGNQTCTAYIQPDETLSLRLRLPPALEKKHGKYLEIQNVLFNYGQKAVLAALRNQNGQALSYRFKKDAKSWKVFVSLALKKEKSISEEGNGAIGIDLNVDHIAYVETDSCGNPIKKKIFPRISYGKTQQQIKAITGEICKEIVQHAQKAKKPIIIEQLDFQKKKLNLKKEHPKFARLLSGFSYGLFFTFLHARAFKHGVEVHAVNPAFTSIIGCVNYAKRYGLSTHLAAALCIARRHQKFSESPISSKGIIPDGKGCQVTFDLPVRNRTKHVWHFWGQVKKKIKAVLAAHHRARYCRS